MTKCSRRDAMAATLAWGGAATLPRWAVAAPAASQPARSEAAPTTGPIHDEPPRADGRRIRTLSSQFERLRNTVPQLAFQAGQDKASFENWRGRVRAKLGELLNVGDVPPQPQPKRLASQPRQGYVLEKWEAYPEPFSAVPFLMLVPDGVSVQSPAPAVMCFPGTGFTKEGLAGEPQIASVWHADDARAAQNQMALDYARAGFVAVAMDNPGVGEMSEPAIPGIEGMNAVGLQALWEGRCYESIGVMQKRCVLEWLKERPIVKRERIAVSGHSFGARYALHLAVMDETVAALVHNENGMDHRRRAWSMGLRPLLPLTYVPGLMNWFDYSDLHAAVAPRPVLFTEGMRPPAIRRLRTAWEPYGAGDRLRVVQHPKYANVPDPVDDSAVAPPSFATHAERQEYAYVDAKNHFFHRDEAVPWLQSHLIP